MGSSAATDRVACPRRRLEGLRAPEDGPAYALAMPGADSWCEPFHEAWREGDGLDLRVRFARAQAAEMAAAVPVLTPGELIIGGDALRPIVIGRHTPFGRGVRVDYARAEALRERYPERAGEIAEIVGYWEGWLAEHPRFNGPVCHASLAYERALELGLDGLGEYVREWRSRNVGQRPECDVWYEALLTVIEGVAAFITAHAVAAEEMAARAETEAWREEWRQIAANCRHVAHHAPETFPQAVQLFYLVFLLCGHDSPGPLDRMLYPALRRDLQRGAITLDQAQEIVDCLWLKLAEKTAYGATLGGQLPDGSDAVSELSFLCLDSIRRLRLLSPRTAVRWHPGLDPGFMRQACAIVAEGATYPAFVNDTAIIAAAVGRGMAPEHAREYTFVGCGQVYPHGRGHGNYEDIMLSAAKPLELALHDGRDPMTGQQVGLHTGDPATFTTYEQLREAVHAQLEALVGGQIQAWNERRALADGQAWDFLRSLLTHSCVERGRDWHAGGADYSEGMVDMVGLTTLTDSLTALKRAVYEEQIISLPELTAIMDADWEGHEDLRMYFLHGLPKFGNGDPEADVLTAEEAAYVNDFIGSHRTHFGGRWGMDIIGWSGAVIYGEQTAATPDGRRRGEALADCAGPAQGRNTRGLTTTLTATARLPHATAHGPLALSLRFPKSAVSGAEGVGTLRAAIETYFRMGGQQVQISVASAADMRAAQAHPEQHRSLMVRVGGFSAYFTQLDKRFQDDMIARSEMEL